MHMDKTMRGQVMGGNAAEKEDNERDKDIFQGLNLDTKKSQLMHKAISGEP